MNEKTIIQRETTTQEYRWNKEHFGGFRVVDTELRLDTNNTGVEYVWVFNYAHEWQNTWHTPEQLAKLGYMEVTSL